MVSSPLGQKVNSEDLMSFLAREGQAWRQALFFSPAHKENGAAKNMETLWKRSTIYLPHSLAKENEEVVQKLSSVKSEIKTQGQ